jgi:hypothetical protein
MKTASTSLDFALMFEGLAWRVLKSSALQILIESLERLDRLLVVAHFYPLRLRGSAKLS